MPTLDGGEEKREKRAPECARRTSDARALTIVDGSEVERSRETLVHVLGVPDLERHVVPRLLLLDFGQIRFCTRARFRSLKYGSRGNDRRGREATGRGFAPLRTSDESPINESDDRRPELPDRSHDVSQTAMQPELEVAHKRLVGLFGAGRAGEGVRGA